MSAAEPDKGIKLFLCYAREDERHVEELRRHLRGLKRQGLITFWYDRNIVPGEEWQHEIDTHLNEAQIILLIVSSYFIDSDYCYGIEMKKALEKHEKEEAIVIPVILSHVYWQGTPFAKLQALPQDAKPILSSSWHTADEAYFNVAQGIHHAIEKFTKKVQEEQQRKKAEIEQQRIQKEQQEHKQYKQRHEKSDPSQTTKEATSNIHSSNQEQIHKPNHTAEYIYRQNRFIYNSNPNEEQKAKPAQIIHATALNEEQKVKLAQIIHAIHEDPHASIEDITNTTKIPISEIEEIFTILTASIPNRSTYSLNLNEEQKVKLAQIIHAIQENPHASIEDITNTTKIPISEIEEIFKEIKRSQSIDAYTICYKDPAAILWFPSMHEDTSNLWQRALRLRRNSNLRTHLIWHDTEKPTLLLLTPYIEHINKLLKINKIIIVLEQFPLWMINIENISEATGIPAEEIKKIIRELALYIKTTKSEDKEPIQISQEGKEKLKALEEQIEDNIS